MGIVRDCNLPSWNKSLRGKQELSHDQASTSDILIMRRDITPLVTLTKSTEQTSWLVFLQPHNVLLPIQQHLAAPVSLQTPRRHLLSETPPPLSSSLAGDVAQPVPSSFMCTGFVSAHPLGQRRRVTVGIRESSAWKSRQYFSAFLVAAWPWTPHKTAKMHEWKF